MAKGQEGIGRLTAEDLEALGGKKPESITEYVKKMWEESEAKLVAAEADAVKAQVLGRVAVIAAGLPITWHAEAVAEHAFRIHAAIEVEYERRKNG